MANADPKKKSGAFWVALGIFLSRVAGLIRERTFAHYFGNSDAGDAFKAALKIPNFLQNLLGEGVLSASMIPVYANLRAHGKNEEADQNVRVIGSILFLTTSILCLIGIYLAPHLISVIAPGFSGEKAILTTQLVRIFFPGISLLVMSAWCLGILNSHRKFFLSYVAPVIWNAAIIGTLFYYGQNALQSDLAIKAAWGLLLGSFLQLLIQSPSTFKLLIKWRPSLNWKAPSVLLVFRNFFPVVVARGVVQLSAYIDAMLASLLPTGAVSALAYAQTIYLLPVSLFGMSVSAAELPAMSEAKGNPEEIKTYLKKRLNTGFAQIAFFIVPTVCVFLVFGDLLVASLFQGGQFDRSSTQYVWIVLMGSTVGLLAGTQGRLYASAFYSLKDTRTPLKCASFRVLITTILGFYSARYLPQSFSLDPKWGTVGLSASAGLAAWLEFLLLRRFLEKKLGSIRLNRNLHLKYWFSAACAVFFTFFLNQYLYKLTLHIWIQTIFSFGLFGIIYILTNQFMGSNLIAVTTLNRFFFKKNSTKQ